MREVRFKVVPAEERRLEELLGALRTNVDVALDAESWLMKTEFAEDFRTRLLVQHVFMRTILYQDAFDAAFTGAAMAAGMDVRPAPPGQRFWDVEVEGRRLSLKSSKAKDLKEKTLHISKLTEAAWIQDCRTARKRQIKTFELFERYTGSVSSIFQLRYFRRVAKYELVEIPVGLFLAVLDLRASAFNSDGPTINIPVGQVPPHFTLKLDRSDAKVTIASILKAECTVHGTWAFPD